MAACVTRYDFLTNSYNYKEGLDYRKELVLEGVVLDFLLPVHGIAHPRYAGISQLIYIFVVQVHR